ncbi:hypothetical protein PLICRDRAFT_101565 [Plicaturopsis crispa FD-325 SS-3]|nr:hypothetical protein PLICRDRAFT_101565 [Plicaturopsis crispa FD-325 SS-3]
MRVPRFFRRRGETPWEVVESKSVEPVPVYYNENDEEELDIVRVCDTDTCGTYVFDLKSLPRGNEFSNALLFARQQLMHEIEKKGYNVLVLESWRLTLFRRKNQHRVEVRYNGRPAHALGKLPSSRVPPFMGVLEEGSATRAAVR